LFRALANSKSFRIFRVVLLFNYQGSCACKVLIFLALQAFLFFALGCCFRVSKNDYITSGM